MDGEDIVVTSCNCLLLLLLLLFYTSYIHYHFKYEQLVVQSVDSAINQISSHQADNFTHPLFVTGPSCSTIMYPIPLSTSIVC